MSVELGIPLDLSQACELAVNPAPTLRKVDVGQIADQNFLLRVGIGFEARMVEGADRQMKDRYGTLAYFFSALQALRDPSIARYEITVDGKTYQTEGITCIVANTGNVGRTNVILAPGIDVSDGLLDVVVVESSDLPSLLSVAASVLSGGVSAQPLHHWQGRAITVHADPPLAVTVDGEIVEANPIQARILPAALSVIVPTVANAETSPV